MIAVVVVALATLLLLAGVREIRRRREAAVADAYWARLVQMVRAAEGPRP